MKISKKLTIVLILSCFICLQQEIRAQGTGITFQGKLTDATSSQPTAFTYQGKLTDGGIPANGTYDFQFTLYDAANTNLGSATGALPVTNGIFTAGIDGAAPLFTSSNPAVFLEIGVKLSGGGSFTTLSPRQPITSAPYAIKSLTAASSESLSVTCVSCVADSQISSLSAGKISGVLGASQGGTGIGGAPPPANTFLRSNGAGWQASGISASDVPSNISVAASGITGVLGTSQGGTGSATQNFVDLNSNQTIAGNKTFTGALSGSGSGLTNLNGANLTPGSVNAPQLGALSVTSTALGDGSVLTNKIPDGAVTAAKIAPGAVFRWQTVIGTSQQAQSNTGYLTNNAGQVIITLPTAPSIGDTVRISGAGAGGWQIAQGPGQSINLSAIDEGWTPRASDQSWISVASSSDGGKLVAVNASDIYTSTDSGANWTQRATPSGSSSTKTNAAEQFLPIPPSAAFVSVASSADGIKLVAVASSDKIYTSSDSGVNWTARESSRFWRSVASSDNGAKLVAAVNSGQIFTSTDSGANWTAREISRAWRSVASSADGSKLVAVAYNNQIFTSTDSGISWTPRFTSHLWMSVASSADGVKLVAVTDLDQIFTSTDSGVSWTARDSARNWKSVASSADGVKLIGVVGPGQIYISIDSGVNWSAYESSRNWTFAASSADGERLVATVGNGKIYISEFTALGTLTGIRYGAIELQYVGGGRFVVLSLFGAVTVN